MSGPSPPPSDRRRFTAAFCASCVLLSALPLHAAELRIPLTGAKSVTRHDVRFTCDANGAKLGLPAGPFTVTYLNGAGNSLAVLPLGGWSLVMAGVTSADGARYVGGHYQWWDVGGRGATLTRDPPRGEQARCHPLVAR